VTPYGLWLVKTGRSTQATNEAMVHGTKLEPEARAAYEEQTGQIMNPLVLQDGSFSASLDGITLAGDLIVEIKCPFRGQHSPLWKEAKDGRVPDHYAAQIQHQLMVAGATTAHLWVYAGGEGVLVTVQRDEEQMQRIRDGWAEFQTYLVSDSPPPLTEKDSALRADAEWSRAAQAYLQAKSAVDAADEALETTRKTLVGLARHPREQGAGVSVVRLWKAGNVDYKKVPQLQGVDLSRYRGQGREEVRVTAVK
jgi:putative phage-type endonuclease